MIYYYICRSCGTIKELPFNPDQDIVWCDNPIHSNSADADGPIAMEIVVPMEGLVSVDKEAVTETKVTLKDCIQTLGMIIVLLFMMGITGIVFIGMIKVWVYIW